MTPQPSTSGSMNIDNLQSVVENIVSNAYQGQQTFNNQQWTSSNASQKSQLQPYSDFLNEVVSMYENKYQSKLPNLNIERTPVGVGSGGSGSGSGSTTGGSSGGGSSGGGGHRSS